MYHTHLSQILWKNFLKPGMSVIDATAGNGHDTIFASKLVLTKNSGWVHAIDNQEDAINKTKERIKASVPINLHHRIILHHMSHEELPKNVTPSLIIYNLGYLPGGDTSKTTQTESTIKSCQKGLDILDPNGMIFITVYPGHSEGYMEKESLLKWISSISNINAFHHSPLNKPNSPSIITLRKY